MTAKPAMILAAALVALSMAPSPCGTVVSIRETNRSEDDRRVLMSIATARFYGLTRGQAVLMLGIYRHELAMPEDMVTFAYFGIRRSDVPITGACRTDEMLFAVCAGVCAQTIRKRCRTVNVDSIKRLNHGYGSGPRRYGGYAEDPDWWRGVIRRMKEFENILY